MQNWRSNFRARYLESLPARMQEVRIRERIEANRQEAIRRRIRSEILRAERERQARIERAREMYPDRFPSEVDEWNEEDNRDVVNVPNVSNFGTYRYKFPASAREGDPSESSYYTRYPPINPYTGFGGGAAIPRWILQRLFDRGRFAREAAQYRPGGPGYRRAENDYSRAYDRYQDRFG
jgi:hypothetical protein